MKKIIPTCFIFLLMPLTGFAVGIQVSPARLNFDINDTKPVSQQVVVANPTADVLVFQAVADDYPALISVNPSVFNLASGDRRTIQITINPGDQPLALGTLTTFLSVASRPQTAQGLSIGTGIKIPIIINLNKNIISGRKNQLNRAPVVFALAVLLIATLDWSLKKFKFKNKDSSQQS